MTLRSSLVAAVILGLLAGAQAARAQGAPGGLGTNGATARALRVAGLAGLEVASGETGLGLRVDGELPIQPMGPSVELSAVGSLGYTRFSDTSSTDSGDYSQATNVLRLVPAARFSMPLAPRLGVYGDAGLGLYWARTSVETPFGDGSESGVGVTMRFAAGSGYDVTRQLRLGAELAWNPYFGDFSDDTLSVLASLVYRL